MKRPLSPHLQVYKWQLTNGMSIAHRMAGVASYIAVGLCMLYVWALVAGEPYFNLFMAVCSNGVVKLGITGLAIAGLYYTLNGFRHLIWHNALGMAKSQVYQTGYAILFLTTIFSLFAIYFIWG